MVSYQEVQQKAKTETQKAEVSQTSSAVFNEIFADNSKGFDFVTVEAAKDRLKMPAMDSILSKTCCERDVRLKCNVKTRAQLPNITRYLRTRLV